MDIVATKRKPCNKSFCEDYLLLSPKDAGLWDLMMLLISNNIGNRKFIDCPDGAVEESFSLRFVIFTSIIAQKLCLLIYEPVAWFGSIFEYLVNLLMDNGGFGMLVWNSLQDKVVIPDKTSSLFSSAIGLIDLRRGLDSKIKHQDPRYKSALSVMAAKVAYENEAYIKDTVEKHWNMELLGCFNFWNDYEEGYATQAFMWSDKTGVSEVIGVSFRGTSPFDTKDWSSDFDSSWYELPGIGKVHAGFHKALGLQKSQGWPKNIHADLDKPYAYYTIRQILKDRLEKNPDAKFIVTGHSLGAALSIVFPAILAYHEETDLLAKLEGVYTFGQPRVGNKKFGEYMTEVLITHGLRYHRFVYCNDLVSRIPFDSSEVYFKHFGECYYYNSFYNGQVLTDAPNKNYFSMFYVVPIFINAVWELFRSFVIGYHSGPDFNEFMPCRGWRMMGLLIAGLSAHGPQDYVNLTRLGSSKLFRI